MNIFSATARRMTALVILPLLMSFLPFTTSDQPYSASNNVKITVQGTSNIHDWDLVSEKGSCTLTLQQDAAGAITGISTLAFSMPVTTLKSKHGNQMDNNAYKAINATTYPSISFKSSSVAVKPGSAGTYQLTANGKLSISSGSKDVVLTGTGKMNPDKTVTITGSYKLKTTDYNVKPISIMLGAIKTSADVTIQYNLTAKPQ